MILWRYILRSHIGPFLFGTVTIMNLFLLQYLMRWIDKFAAKGLALSVIMEFIILNLSWIVVLAVPIGVLFSTLMAFGAMSSAHEVTVFKASGMGLFRMMVPVIVVGSMLWMGVYWYSDNVLPDTNLRLSTMMSDIERVKPTFVLESGQFTTQIESFTILAREVDSNGVLYGVTIYDNSRADRRNVLSADTGRMGFSPSLTKLVLQLYHGEIHQINKRRAADYRVITFDRHQVSMPADRFFFESSDGTGSSRGDREMRIADMEVIVDRSTSSMSDAEHALDSVLHDHIVWLAGTSSASEGGTVPGEPDIDAVTRAAAQISTIRSKLEPEAFRRQSEEQTVQKYGVEIHKKYAIPAACILFVLVGCPMGILTKGGNFGISAAISLGFYVLYWASLIGGEKLADRGYMDPALAMWLGNILIAIIGVFVTIKVNYETTPLKGIMLWLRNRSTATER